MKKKIIQKQFDRRIKIWSVIISPILVALISALTSIIVIYISSTSDNQSHKPIIEYRITEKDSLDIVILSAQIDTLRKRHYNSDDPIELDKLNVELTILAQKEADIYQKYFPNYQPRWPDEYPAKGPSPLFFFGIVILIPVLLLLILGIMFVIRPILRRVFHKIYEIEQ